MSEIFHVPCNLHLCVVSLQFSIVPAKEFNTVEFPANYMSFS